MLSNAENRNFIVFSFFVSPTICIDILFATGQFVTIYTLYTFFISKTQYQKLLLNLFVNKNGLEWIN